MSNPQLAELIEELSCPNANTLRIKTLCKNSPGLIATAGRVRIWTLLLLGNAGTIQGDVEAAQVDCREMQVLEADIPRTRADVEEFRSVHWRLSVRTILQRFCVQHGVKYTQGMNEVLAPFLYILPPPSGTLLPYSLFEAFTFRYLERALCVDESAHLFQAFRLFHLLLLYFDPQLATHLQEQDSPPELYSPHWFLTLYAHALPLPQVLRLWDMLIAVDDPSFTFFIGLCLLLRRRDQLLLADRERIPEILMRVQFQGEYSVARSTVSLAQDIQHDTQGEGEIDEVLTQAREAYDSTPRCFLRYLRLCAVSTTELMPQPKGGGVGGAGGGDGAKGPHPASPAPRLIEHDSDCSLAIQSARGCLALSPQELVPTLAPSLAPSLPSPPSLPNGLAEDPRDERSKSPRSLPIPLPTPLPTPLPFESQFVLIDIRSHEDRASGGSLPRAVQLDPLFLSPSSSSPFGIWLQHFDATRGCRICIVDLPPARWTGVALWRRLLLGEGDGAREPGVGSPGWKGSEQGGQGERRDLESKWAREETATVEADATRPAMQLARILQAHSFPHVCILEGGFPALVKELKRANNGQVEPVILDHDPYRWEEFLQRTGRTERAGRSASTTNSSSAISASALSPRPKHLGDLDRKDVYHLAIKVAARLDHPCMEAVLRDRLALEG